MTEAFYIVTRRGEGEGEGGVILVCRGHRARDMAHVAGGRFAGAQNAQGDPPQGKPAQFAMQRNGFLG